MDTKFDVFLYDHTVRGPDKETMLFTVQDAYELAGGDPNTVPNELRSRDYQVTYLESVKGLDITPEMKSRLENRDYDSETEKQFNEVTRSYIYSYQYSNRK